MARDTTKNVTVYHPETLTPNDVSEERAEVLKARGYTTSKPRQPKSGKTSQAADNSAAMQAEIDRLKAENESLKAGPQAPNS